MLKIRGISNAENLLTGVNRFGHCLTTSLSSAATVGQITYVFPKNRNFPGVCSRLLLAFHHSFYAQGCHCNVIFAIDFLNLSVNNLNPNLGIKLFFLFNKQFEIFLNITKISSIVSWI